LLANAGAEVNHTSGKDSEAPIHYSTKFGHVEATELLLKLSADVDIMDVHGTTAMHHAVHYEHIDVLQVLLKSKANPYLKNVKGITPLELALRVGNFDASLILNARYRNDGKEYEFESLNEEEEINARHILQEQQGLTRLSRKG